MDSELLKPKSSLTHVAKTLLCGKDIHVDAAIRHARSAFYPKKQAWIRQLFVQVQLTQWLHHYPAPASRNSAEYEEWRSGSRFTREEVSAGIRPIMLRTVFPIWADCIVTHGMNVDNCLKAGWPPGWGSQTWVLITSSSCTVKQSDADFVASRIGQNINVVKEKMYFKNSILGAALLAPPERNKKTESVWLQEDYGEPIRIIATISFRFDANGPSKLFSHCTNVEGFASVLNQNHAKERVEAIRKKLHKYKFNVVLDPSIKMPVAAPRPHKKRRCSPGQGPKLS